MFGYLFPTKAVLTMSERKIFRNYYCTLCLAHQYRYGRISTILNNYDLGVFAILLNLYGDKIEDCGNCARKVMNRREKFTEKKWGDIVDFNINLIRKKFDDDNNDNPGPKTVLSYLVTNEIYTKCKKNNFYLYDTFDLEFKNFLAIENQKPQINDILNAYEIFARNTFGRLVSAEREQINLFAYINRWVYWIDAVDDYDKDIKNRSYNPYVSYSGERSKSQFLENNMLNLINAYEEHRQNIESAYLKCSYPQPSRIIIENIIACTIRNTTKLILENGSIPKRRKLL